jgi:hypothetical protein
MKITYVTESHTFEDDKTKTSDVVSPRELEDRLRETARTSQLKTIEKNVSKAEQILGALREEHDALSQQVLGNSKTRAPGLIHAVDSLSEEVRVDVAGRMIDVSGRLNECESRTVGMEHRLLKAIEEGHWQEVFRSEIEADVNALQNWFRKVSGECEKLRALVAELRSTEQRIKDLTISFGDEVPVILQRHYQEKIAASLKEAQDQLAREVEAAKRIRDELIPCKFKGGFFARIRWLLFGQ